MLAPVPAYLILSENVLHESLQKLILRFVAGLCMIHSELIDRLADQWTRSARRASGHDADHLDTILQSGPMHPLRRSLAVDDARTG